MKNRIYVSIILLVALACGIIIAISAVVFGTAQILLPLLFICLGAIGISCVIAYFMARKYTKPIAKTAEIIREAAKNSDIEFLHKKTDDPNDVAKGVTQIAGMLESTMVELSNKNNSLRAMLKAIPSAVIAVDNEKKIIMTNSKAKELFGVSTDCENRPFIECVANISIEQLIDRCFSSKHTVEDERPILTTHSEEIYNIIVSPIKSEEGKVYGAVLFAQNITEARQLEMLRSEFSANVSYELKSPLTVINGFIDTLKSDGDMAKEARDKLLDIMSGETARMSRLIDDIMALSEIEYGILMKKENVDVKKCVCGVAEFYKDACAEKGMRLITETDEDSISVVGSTDRVRQAVMNLVENSMRYSDSGALITITAHKVNGKCEIAVSDTGVGISLEDQKRMFERFYRVDKTRSRAVEGTGLGLSIVKHIVLSMNGSIAVKSKQGEGSAFTITLPLA